MGHLPDPFSPMLAGSGDSTGKDFSVLLHLDGGGVSVLTDSQIRLLEQG